jgi:hypothetical protein
MWKARLTISLVDLRKLRSRSTASCRACPWRRVARWSHARSSDPNLKNRFDATTTSRLGNSVTRWRMLGIEFRSMRQRLTRFWGYARLLSDIRKRLDLLCGERQHDAIVLQLELRRHYSNLCLAYAEKAANTCLQLCDLARSVTLDCGDLADVFSVAAEHGLFDPCLRLRFSQNKALVRYCRRRRGGRRHRFGDAGPARRRVRGGCGLSYCGSRAKQNGQRCYTKYFVH